MSELTRNTKSMYSWKIRWLSSKVSSEMNKKNCNAIFTALMHTDVVFLKFAAACSLDGYLSCYRPSISNVLFIIEKEKAALLC